MAFWAPIVAAVAGKALEGNPQASPVERRMGSMQQDPLNQLKAGKAALASMDTETQARFAPVLDEAIQKSAQERQAKMQKQGPAEATPTQTPPPQKRMV